MSVQSERSPVARWSVGGAFLEAFATRDYDLMAATLSPSVVLRAMLPRGPVSWEGPAAVADAFRGWFQPAEDFELLDASVGEIGGRLHLSWRLRVRPAPSRDGWHVIEQQVFADTQESICSLDLLCSGFRPEPTTATHL